MGLNLRKLILSSIFLIIVSSLVALSFWSQTKAQPDHIIENRGQTWPYPMIGVCIITQENQSWWKPEYLDSALNGVAMWNDAIQEFSLNYPEYDSLSKLSLVPTVTNEPVSGFDIYMGWIAECGLESTIGQTKLLVSGCSTINSTVCLAAKAPSGHVMTEVDMQNIVVHELGHNFGLGHCYYSEDVMYEVVQYHKTVKPLSTLNLYAVSQNFGWMQNSSQFNLSNSCPEVSTLTLPSNIPYELLEIGKENTPTITPQSFTERLMELFLRPETIFGLAIGVILIFVLAIIVKTSQK